MRTSLIFICAFALSGVVIGSPQAAAYQSVAPASANNAKMPAQPKPIDARFMLGGGDQILVQVVDLDDIPDKPIRIDPDGSIDLPLIGRMQAAGLNISEFKQALAARLGKYIANPQISVNLIDAESSSVSVVGEVNSPGVHELPGPRTLIEVISLAGGIKPDAGSKVIVTREMKYGVLPLPGAKQDTTGRYSTAAVSLDDLMASKIPAENIPVQPEDIVSVPKGDIVYVIGDVKRAGGFPLSSHETMTLLQALALAEGLGPDAQTQRAKILRPVGGDGKMPLEIPVNVKSIFEGKAPDVPVYANDILFIPNSAAKSGTRRAAEAVLQVATGMAIYR